MANDPSIGFTPDNQNPDNVTFKPDQGTSQSFGNSSPDDAGRSMGSSGRTGESTARTGFGDVGVSSTPTNTGTSFNSGTTGRTGMGDAGSTIDRAKEMGSDALKNTTEKLNASRENVAGKLEQVGSTLTERAGRMEQQGGIAGKAAAPLRSASGAIETSADYIRRKDVDAMKDDLAGRIRENPLMSVGIALGAGFLISRILD